MTSSADRARVLVLFAHPAFERCMRDDSRLAPSSEDAAWDTDSLPREHGGGTADPEA